MSIRIHCTIRQDQPFVLLQIHPGKALTHINIRTSDNTSCSEFLDNLNLMLYQLLLQKTRIFVALVNILINSVVLRHRGFSKKSFSHLTAIDLSLIPDLT